MKSERQSNIELLRIISMIGVIVLHYNNKNIGGGLRYVEPNSTNYFLLMALESLSICAVDLYMIISGFFSYKTKKTTIQKPFELLFQVIIFSFGWNLFTNIAQNALSLKSIIGSLVPANYFVILYIAVYFLSPYLNLIYEKINVNFIMVILELFSIYPTVVEIFSQMTSREWLGLSTIGMYGSQWGYQIVNFVMMYYLGMFIRKYIDKIYKISQKKLVVAFVMNLTLIFCWACFSEHIGYSRNLALIYCNPFVILEAAIVFCIFAKFNIGCNRRINKLSSATFTVFLLHGYIINYVRIDWAVKQNPLILLIHVLFSSVLIYIACYAVYVVYDTVTKPVFVRLRKKDKVITKI